MGAETSAPEMVLPPRRSKFMQGKPAVGLSVQSHCSVKETVCTEQTHCKILYAEHQSFFLLLSCSKQESNQRNCPEPRFRTSLSHVRTTSKVKCALNRRFPSRAVSLAVPNGHATSRHTNVWALIQEDAGWIKCFTNIREVCENFFCIMWCNCKFCR